MHVEPHGMAARQRGVAALILTIGKTQTPSIFEFELHPIIVRDLL
jgi:hypothetical protein